MHYLLLDLNVNFTYIKELINFLINNNPQDFIHDLDRVKRLCSKCHSIKKYFIEIDEFDHFKVNKRFKTSSFIHLYGSKNKL